MAEIKYIKGDTTNPKGNGRILIPHICNDIGAWGAGFVLAISKKWSQPEFAYRQWYKKGYYTIEKTKIPFDLGQIQLIPVEYNISVVNMIAQKGIRQTGADPPIRYKAVQECLQKLCLEAININATIHMPRIGCNLAGGDWDIIKEIIHNELIKEGINVFIYDLP